MKGLTLSLLSLVLLEVLVLSLLLVWLLSVLLVGGLLLDLSRVLSGSSLLRRCRVCHRWLVTKGMGTGVLL